MARPARDDTSTFFDFGLLTATRTIYIGEYPTGAFDEGGGTDYRLADRVIKGLHILEARSHDPINLIVNNPGGQEYDGLAIYDAIRLSPAMTTVTVLGHAMSMASWFMQAADKRIMAPCATMMIHYGSWYYEGHAQDFTRWNRENSRMMRLMETHYMERIRQKHPKYKLSKLREKLLFDSFLPAQEAVDLGLADTLMEYPV